jgi:hypothetical protein
MRGEQMEQLQTYGCFALANLTMEAAISRVLLTDGALPVPVLQLSAPYFRLSASLRFMVPFIRLIELIVYKLYRYAQSNYRFAQSDYQYPYFHERLYSGHVLNRQHPLSRLFVPVL